MLSGDTACRTCSANAVCMASRDGCICKDGYIPKASTSSQDGTLECSACAAGTYSKPADITCTQCPAGHISSAAAGFCVKCSYQKFTVDTYEAQVQANAAQTACVCATLRARAGYAGCTTSGTGALATCTCPPAPTSTTGTLVVTVVNFSVLDRLDACIECICLFMLLLMLSSC
jgi:hypothetical protein